MCDTTFLTINHLIFPSGLCLLQIELSIELEYGIELESSTLLVCCLGGYTRIGGGCKTSAIVEVYLELSSGISGGVFLYSSDLKRFKF